jgi:hypothetical protein
MGATTLAVDKLNENQLMSSSMRARDAVRHEHFLLGNLTGLGWRMMAALKF